MEEGLGNLTGTGTSEWFREGMESTGRREVVSLSWSEGEGHLRKAVVTEVGELVLSQRTLALPLPPPQAHQLSPFFLYCGGK